jgi:hypothetical protein
MVTLEVCFEKVLGRWLRNNKPSPETSFVPAFLMNIGIAVLKNDHEKLESLPDELQREHNLKDMEVVR